jgi:outer membrane lipoprotein-sorting protein
MKRIAACLLIAVMVVSCIGLAACGGGGDGAATTDNGGATTDNGGAETADGDDGGNGDGDSLADILGQGTGTDSVSYVMEITAPGAQTSTMQIWVEQDKMRTEMTQQGQTIIYLADYDAGTAYMYMPDQNMAYKVDVSQVNQADYEDVQSIPNYNPTVISTETIDGKVCLVVEYSYSGATVRSWIWKEHGFPVRTETTTADGTTVVEYRDIEFGDIDDSLFELPAGVQVIDL